MPQTSGPRILRLGTRGSRLARAQSEIVRAELRRATGLACELIVVKTTGDRIQDRPLADAGGKGLFTKELEEALFADEIDLAVHSMKDVPVALPPGLFIGAILPREDPTDAFLSHRAKSIDELPNGSVVGTSSVRRTAQLLRARPDVVSAMLRGNVDTRLAKLDVQAFDAIILATAGLKRLGLESRVTSFLSTDIWLPALAQGAVGIEIRADDITVARAVSQLNDPLTSIALACERAFQSALDGSCRTPIAGVATIANKTLEFRGEVLAQDGSGFEATQFALKLGADPEHEASEAGHAAGLALKPRALAWLVP